MTSTLSVFDIVGPIMIGPSSSHTAGAVRLGLLARAILGETPIRARIVLHGSFASTHGGHGTDLALIAGLLGMRPDDPGIIRSFEIARERGLVFTIDPGDLGNVHPNTARLTLECESAPGEADSAPLEITGSSTGGGEVVVTRIGEFDTHVTGRMPLLVVAHTDLPGEVASVTAIIASAGANIAGMEVSRERRGASALMLIETDTALGESALARIAELPGVTGVRAVPPV